MRVAFQSPEQFATAGFPQPQGSVERATGEKASVWRPGDALEGVWEVRKDLPELRSRGVRWAGVGSGHGLVLWNTGDGMILRVATVYSTPHALTKTRQFTGRKGQSRAYGIVLLTALLTQSG
jgi:hypothetical protein